MSSNNMFPPNLRTFLTFIRAQYSQIDLRTLSSPVEIYWFSSGRKSFEPCSISHFPRALSRARKFNASFHVRLLWIKIGGEEISLPLTVTVDLRICLDDVDAAPPRDKGRNLSKKKQILSRGRRERDCEPNGFLLLAIKVRKRRGYTWFQVSFRTNKSRFTYSFPKRVA